MDDEDDSSSGFSCMRCAFCCQLDVEITKKEIERIKKLGKKSFYYSKEGRFFLKKGDKYCVFLDKGYCSIYDNRPMTCRKFPIESDGSISPKCRTQKDFSSKVIQKIIKFSNEEESDNQQ